VAVRVFESEAEQQRAMWAGTRRLLLLTIPPPLKAIVGRLPNRARLAFGRSAYGKPAELLGDCVTVAADQLIERAGGPAWDQEGFARLRDEVRGELVATVEATVEQVTRILEAAAAVERRLSGSGSGGLGLLPSLTDVRAQLGELVYPGFVTATGWARLPDVERYLTAIQVRLDKLPVNPARDAERLRRVQQVEHAYQELAEELGDGEEVRRIWWMIQELRVSLFATTMRTAYPVSEQRIYRAMDELAA
jgi:ATP-dependent helicase HrpA